MLVKLMFNCTFPCTSLSLIRQTLRAAFLIQKFGSYETINLNNKFCDNIKL